MNTRFTPRATDEFDRIVAGLAILNPAAAQRFKNAVERAVRLLAAQPRRGAEFPTSNPRLSEVRHVGIRRFKNYVILYTLTATEVLILHVAHGRRDLDALLARD